MSKNQIKKYLTTGAFVLATATASAQNAPIPQSQWTPQTQIWLSRAMVAEAGWQSKRDHIAIAYVLARRWRRLIERWPTLRFLDIIRNYCSGLGDYRRDFTQRQKWLRELSWNDLQPINWPKKIPWQRHLTFWRSILTLSDRWSKGEVPDPCRGRAWHWGGVIDMPRGRMIPINCGETENTFYSMLRKLEHRPTAVKKRPR